MTVTDGCAEFNHPRLAAIYDALCPPGPDAIFFLDAIARLRPASVVDFGCGTGALTVEIARLVPEVTGVEPAGPMLAIARARDGGEGLRWIDGGRTQLAGLAADMVMMTAHVAQFMVEDDEWAATLAAIAAVLPPGGHLMFDSRNPLDRVWERYTRERTFARFDTGAEGRVGFWADCVACDGRVAVHELHYHFEADGTALVSRNRMIYRPAAELRAGLDAAGFDVVGIAGDWDGRPMTDESPEIIITARRR